jgi:riboflavin biosynthesis pyrimidine reductase
METAATPALALLYERAGLPQFGIPRSLAELYAGDLGFRRPCLYANFVASLDGVVALAVPGDSGPLVSQHSAADRFVMGLLRASADAILIGAGTFRKGSGDIWSAEAIHPACAPQFAELRAALGLAPLPQLVIVTRSGAIDVTQPAVRDAWIATSASGASVLRGRVPASARIVVLDAAMRMAELVALLQREQLTVLLTEGGPSLFAQLVAERLVDELFLTSSPALFGRFPGDARKALADGVDLDGTPLELLSLRRQASHLFARYAFAARRAVTSK